MAWTESYLFVWGMGNVSGLGPSPDIDKVFQPTLIDLTEGSPSGPAAVCSLPLRYAHPDSIHLYEFTRS